jgi:hypothetical protein
MSSTFAEQRMYAQEIKWTKKLRYSLDAEVCVFQTCRREFNLESGDKYAVVLKQKGLYLNS